MSTCSRVLLALTFAIVAPTACSTTVAEPVVDQSTAALQIEPTTKIVDLNAQQRQDVCTFNRARREEHCPSCGLDGAYAYARVCSPSETPHVFCAPPAPMDACVAALEETTCQAQVADLLDCIAFQWGPEESGEQCANIADVCAPFLEAEGCGQLLVQEVWGPKAEVGTLDGPCNLTTYEW